MEPITASMTELAELREEQARLGSALPHFITSELSEVSANTGDRHTELVLRRTADQLLTDEARGALESVLRGRAARVARPMVDKHFDMGPGQAKALAVLTEWVDEANKATTPDGPVAESMVAFAVLTRAADAIEGASG